MVDESLIAAFDAEMMNIYHRALSEARYKAMRFFDMLHEHGGLRTAQILINAAKVSDGYHPFTIQAWGFR